MGKLIQLARWVRVSYEMAKDEIFTFEVKVLGPLEWSIFKAEYFKAVAQFMPAAGDVEKATTDEQRAQIGITHAEKLVSLLPMERVQQVFKEWVRNVEDLGDEQGLITTGERLFAWADQQLVAFVLQEIVSHATLSPAHTKASSSPSTSASAPAGGGSDAPSIGVEGGLASSTVTPIPNGPESSGVVEQSERTVGAASS